jgi:hypothetical protein
MLSFSQPQRSTRLAAQELQDQIVKISGARLPIVTQPTSHAVMNCGLPRFSL